MNTTGTATTSHPCNCGCSKCKEECCELDCLVQPRFFCGQMLTDQDLTALLDWVKGKSALTRYRHGWGVVCGLDVRCASTPGSGPVIGVSPGYAIDCCGNDVIVCADATLDLSTCCSPPAAPCNGKTPAAPPAQGGNDLQSFGPFTLPRAQVQAVDVLIRYKETQSDAKSGLSRGGCSGATACEYTRTHEDYELYCNPVEDCDDPTDKHAYDWYNAYEEGLAKLLETLDRLRSDADPLHTVGRLLQWLRQNPPRSFCFLCDYLCDLQTTGKFPENWFNELAFWIVQDWRISYLHCLCDGCGPETGVRLARVWLWRRTDSQGKQQLKVVYINEYPPFRRPVKRECWPAPADSVSLAPFIWQTADSSCGPLRQLGISDVTFQPLEYSDLADFGGQLRRENIFVCCADREEVGSLIGYYKQDHCGQSRVVYFGTAQQAKRQAVDTAQLPSNSPELDLRKVDGIADGISKRLQARGILNLIDLANATPQTVKEALSTMPIQQPDEARSAKFIADAQAVLEQLKKGG